MGAPDILSGIDADALVGSAWASGFAPPPRIGVREWADQRRRLPTKSGGEPGQWRTSRVPYGAEIMDELSPSSQTQRVVLMKSVQSGGTEFGNNWLGWFIDTQKAPFMAVQPTLDMAERWSKQRLTAMIDDCATLREKIAPARSRDSGNTVLLKEWAGGVLIISGANSGASLRSMPAKYLFLDEIDAYPQELDGEGDPVRLAEARSTTFPRRKIFLVSTPTIESLSRIHKEWLASDQRRYHVACPHCGHKQPLIWDNLLWPEGKPSDPLYYCADCGEGIAEHHKTAMLRTIEEGGAAEWIPTHPERATAGFHINALYTPLGLGLTWPELAAEWEEAKKDPAREKTFRNLRLGEVVADPNEKFDPDDLASRAGTTPLREIPPGCLAITVGIDVQKDRFAILMLGHGRQTTWVLDYTELPADPTTQAAWDALDAWLAQPLTNVRGRPMRPLMTAIDNGYLTDNVLAWTRERKHRQVIAVKGASTPGKPIINRPSKLDVTLRGRTIKHGAEGWLVGVDTAKHNLFARLSADGKRSLTEHHSIRFAKGLDPSFYTQLTAEVWEPAKRRWVKLRPRNEALDAFIYAMAAAHHPGVRIHLWKEPQWAMLEAALEPATADLFDAIATAPAVPPVSSPRDAAQTPAPPSATPAATLAQAHLTQMLRARAAQRHGQRR